jgi:hypothetical protein
LEGGMMDWKVELESWKFEAGEIPENTCPIIDDIITEVDNFIGEIEYLQKNVRKYDTPEELADDFPSFGWNNPMAKLDDKIRTDNERLRELGKFWYKKCCELVNILESTQEGREE